MRSTTPRLLALAICFATGCIFAPGSAPDTGGDDAGPADVSDEDTTPDATGGDAGADASDLGFDMTPVESCADAPDNSPCDADQDPCTLDSCLDGECIGGPVRSCPACQTCDDGQCIPDSSADGDQCGASGSCFDHRCADGRCQLSVEPERCLIEDTCFLADDRNPDDPCVMCDPGESTTDWSPTPAQTDCDENPDDCLLHLCDGAGGCQGNPLPDDTACDSGAEGGLCEGGTCVAVPDQECRIGGEAFAVNAENPDNECQVCNPAVDQYDWTNRTVGTSCGAGEKDCTQDVCNDDGECETLQKVDGTSCDDDPDDCTKSECQAGTCVSEDRDGETCKSGCGTGTCNAENCLVIDSDNGCVANNACYPAGVDHPTDPCLHCTALGWAVEVGTQCGLGGQGEVYVCNDDGDCCQTNNPAVCQS